MYKAFVKRTIDFTISLIVLIVISPLLIIVGVLIKLDSTGPIFFIQERLGFQYKVFKLYKFRTMVNKPREVNREIQKGDPEVTRIGAWLRRLKIDELPQLLNILKGDMSLVGPRPGIASQISRFNEDGQYRLKVKPGLTGLAQVHGNIHLSWPERWVYDRRYVENLNFLLDIKIILKTIIIVIFGEDKFIKKPNV
jgi:undecaprenyl phosphate N,N'-diacetylbacillosamine 1-phosphate transferase